MTKKHIKTHPKIISQGELDELTKEVAEEKSQTAELKKELEETSNFWRSLFIGFAILVIFVIIFQFSYVKEKIVIKPVIKPVITHVVDYQVITNYVPTYITNTIYFLTLTNKYESGFVIRGNHGIGPNVVTTNFVKSSSITNGDFLKIDNKFPAS
jgi:hypothetical protein